MSPGSNGRQVDGQVGLAARVRLHVGVLGAEQLLGPVAGQVFDDVDVLAAAVIAPAGIALGVFVRQHAADRLHHGGAGVVLAGDHFQAVGLALDLAGHGGPNFRVFLFKPIHQTLRYSCQWGKEGPIQGNAIRDAGNSIEIGGGDVAVLGDLAFVPAGTADPFARLDQSDLGLYTGDDFSYRSGIRELDTVEFLDASVSDVGVGVDKAGGGGMTVEVDGADAGSIAREFQNFGVGTDFHDNAMADGDGLGYRIVGIYGEDVAVN